MNKKILRTQIELNNVLLPIFIIYSVLICGFYMMYNDLFVILYTGIFLLSPIIYFLSYYFIKNIFIYLLVHIISFLLVIFLSPTDSYRFVFITLSIIFICIFIYKKCNPVAIKPSSYGYFPTVAIIISFYISKDYNSKFVSISITLLFIFYILLCMYNKYLCDTYDFCCTAAEECIPSFLKARVIFKKIWQVFIFFTLIFMSLTSFIPTTNLVSNVSRLLKNLLGSILSKISGNNVSQFGDDLSSPPPDLMPIKTIKPPENDTIKHINSTNFYIVFIIFLVVCLIILVIGLFISPNKNECVKEDDTTFINPFEKDKLSVSRKKKTFSAIFSNSINQRIRKIFYKTITDNIDERLNVKGSLTAEQLCEITYEKVDRDTLYKMKKIYDKARYSENSCTRKDLVTMKDLAKKCNVNTKEAYKEE